MIELRSVWFKYDKRWVLRDVNIAFKRGTIVVIIGPNGSGKTTLMKVAGLIYKPTRGEVLYNGVNVWSLPKQKRLEARRHVVYVHETPILLRGTVRDNLTYGLKIRGYSEDRIEEEVESIVESLRLRSLLDKKTGELSAGQSQLVAIARALVVKPQVLFLDEPFAHLDREKRSIVSTLLREYARGRGMGIVLATHDEYLAEQLADNVVNIGEIQGGQNIG